MTDGRTQVSGETDASSRADGIFLVGAPASGVQVLAGALSRLGVPMLGTEGGRPERLRELNERLLAARGESPEATTSRLLRDLRAHALSEDVRSLVETVAQAVAAQRGNPWLWADWQMSFLASFWSESLNARPAVILLHRSPDEVAAAAGEEVLAPGVDILESWDRCNRAALVLCSNYPSLVVSYDYLVSRPKLALMEVIEFLADLRLPVDADLESATQYLESVTPDPAPSVSAPEIAPRYRTLNRLLDQFDVAKGGDSSTATGSIDSTALTTVTAEFYDESYYGTAYDRSGIPYSRNEKFWLDFFATVARSISTTLNPESVLDVGCAIGLLVEALRNLGIDAHGIDISEWALERIPPHLTQFCQLGSITEEIDGSYDLITCVEVLEHLPPTLADDCIGNLCRHAEMVLFSSSPDDFDEPTHLNVEPSSYWARLFLRHGFVRDVDYDATYLSPHAILFRRGDIDMEAIVDGYERALSIGGRQSLEYRQLFDHHERLKTEAAAVSAARDELQQEAAHLGEALEIVEQRRVAETVASFDMVREFEAGQRKLAALLAQRDSEIAQMRNTKTFRYTTKLRKVYGRLRRRRAPAPADPAAAVFPPDGTYSTWIRLFDTLDDAARRRLERRVAELEDPPTISVIMPVYDPPVGLLRSAIESVQKQIYPKWELCIADDFSPNGEVAALIQEYVDSDPRIKFVRRGSNGHISAASNSALALATGQWVAPLDHDDLLAEHALALLAFAICEHPDAGIVYSDEDKIDASGVRCDPFFKPDFDPLLLLGQNFVSHLSAFRKAFVDRVGGYREGYEGSQDWDLTLRVSELLETQQVVHVPHVLYHWRIHNQSTSSLVSAKPYAIEAGRRAVTDHLARIGQSGRAMRVGKSGHVRVAWELPDPPPMVSIVIPTRDGRLLQRCIDSVLSLTVYPNFEVVVVDNASVSYETLSYLQNYDDRLKVIRDERPFNYAMLNNHAVDRTSGDVVCLLNDDTEIINADWLSEMVGQLLQPGVGAVGAKLTYDDGRIQHAGVVLGIYGVAGHGHRMFDRLSSGHSGHLQLAHRVSAVTAACAVFRRAAWNDVRGFDDTNLPVAFNDVDICLRLQDAGWSVVWTPYAELFHRESISRGSDFVGARSEAFRREVAYMEQRWGFERLRNDPYYNPNLAFDAEDFSLAWPPRVSLASDV